MNTTSEMRARIRQLASPAKDDFDRAVLFLCDHFDSHDKALRSIALQRDEVMDGKDAGSWAKMVATQALKEPRSVSQ